MGVKIGCWDKNKSIKHFHLNYPHDHIKGEESLPQRIALDRSIGSGEIWKMFYFLAPTGALGEGILSVRACVCVCVTFLKRTLQMSF